MQIRPETPHDIDAIHRVNTAAFGQAAEGDLVNALRDAGALTLSLVAERDDAIVGHIAFSPAHIETSEGQIPVIGLAPMSVLPEYQNTGIGSQLVREGLRHIEAAGHRYVIVLGHKAYYPRFGFVVAAEHGVQCEYDVPPEHFMIQALNGASLDAIAGTARYHTAFAAV